MKRIHRRPLDQRTLSFLTRRQVRVDAGQLVQQAWRTARSTRALNAVRDILRAMVGIRERCFFCEDSRGSDIEHFWPKALYPQHLFSWDNLLLVCATCNRLKGTRFPLDGAGIPLLINPTADDPWVFLFLDPATGNVVARIDPQTGLPMPRGAATVDPEILPLNIEAVTEGRVRTSRRLRASLDRFLVASVSAVAEQAALAALIQEVRDIDAQGVVSWFLLHDGRQLQPFRTMQTNHAQSWAALIASHS